MPPATTTVRVASRTHRLLQDLARATGKPMTEVLEEAVEQYQADRFFAELDAAYRALRADPGAWRDEQEERSLLDNTLPDGLGDA